MAVNSQEEGQATTEYILLISVIVGSYLLVAAGLQKLGLQQKISAVLTGGFSAAYQFGHTKAKGFNNGGPVYHPRIESGDNNFRLFFNPSPGGSGGNGT
jgi:hypothetical protein